LGGRGPPCFGRKRPWWSSQTLGLSARRGETKQIRGGLKAPTLKDSRVGGGKGTGLRAPVRWGNGGGESAVGGRKCLDYITGTKGWRLGRGGRFSKTRCRSQKKNKRPLDGEWQRKGAYLGIRKGGGKKQRVGAEK